MREAEPEDDEHEAGDLLERALADRARERRDRDAERDEDAGEARDERHARDDRATRRDAAADRREVAGHERQHARRDERREAGEERERDPAGHAASGLEARELFVDAALELRIERRAAGRRRSAPAAPAPRGRTEHDRAARAHAASGNSHASRSNPCVAGRATTDGPNVAISLSSICERVSPAAMRREMNAFMRSAIGELDWSSVVWQVGQITSPSSSPCVGCASLASAGAAQQEQRGDRYEESASWMHCCSVSFVTAPGTCATTRPARSAQNVSGTPVSPYFV